MWWRSLALCVHVCIPHCIGLVDYLFMFYFVLQLLCVFFFCSVLHYRHIPFVLKFYKKSKFYQNQMYIRAASTFWKNVRNSSMHNVKAFAFVLPVLCKFKCLCSVQNRMEVSTYFKNVDCLWIFSLLKLVYSC